MKSREEDTRERIHRLRGQWKVKTLRKNAKNKARFYFKPSNIVEDYRQPTNLENLESCGPAWSLAPRVDFT